MTNPIPGAPATGDAPGRDVGLPPAGAPYLRRRVLLHSGIQVAGKAASGVALVALLSVLTRYLGPAGFGRYTFVLGYIALFYVLTDLGLQSIAVRDMVRFPDRSTRVVGELLSFKLALGAVSLVCAVAIAWLAPLSAFSAPGVRPAVLLAGLGLLATAVLTSAGAVFQTQLRMQVPALADVISRLVGLAGVVVLVLGAFGRPSDGGARLVGVLAATTFGAICASGFAFAGARRLLHFRPVLEPSHALAMARDALPLGTVLVLGVIHYRIDILILAGMKGMSTVGQYGVATKLLDVAIAGSAVFTVLVFPVLSARSLGDRALFQRSFQKAMDVVLIAGFGIAVLGWALAPDLVPLLAGNAFLGAAQPVAIIAWACPILFAGIILSQMVVVANRQLVAVPVVVAATALNVVLNVLLIPALGATGPAVATVVSESAVFAGFTWIVVRHFGFGPSAVSAARIVAAALVFALVVLALRPTQPILAAAAGCAVYLAALFVTRVITIEDLATVLGGDAPFLPDLR